MPVPLPHRTSLLVRIVVVVLLVVEGEMANAVSRFVAFSSAAAANFVDIGTVHLLRIKIYFLLLLLITSVISCSENGVRNPITSGIRLILSILLGGVMP